MKLACSVSVGNRLLPALAINQTKKHAKSTLALCKHPKSEEYCIILFSSQNKTGTKYRLKGNVSQILTRFIADGKATIQFKAPPHDLYVQADVIQLKGFLLQVKRALDNKISPKEVTYSSMSVTPVAAKDLPPKKLVIRNRSEYPLKGFPRTLELLSINNVQRCSLDRGILQLSKLRTLDLSQNCIEFLPEELNRLPNLMEVNLSSNCLGKSSPKQWSWLGGNLSKSLILLNLASNGLKFLPDEVVRLRNLVNLQINDNQLKLLPAGIGNLRNLVSLMASNNSLTVLPGSARKLRLQVIDLSNNSFEANRSAPAAPTPRALSICSLKECAARAVLNLGLPYGPGAIPLTLATYLNNARYCVCGKACFEVFVRAPEMLLLSNIAQVYSLSFGGSPVVPVDCFFCSLKCYRTSHSARSRNPVI